MTSLSESWSLAALLENSAITPDFIIFCVAPQTERVFQLVTLMDTKVHRQFFHNLTVMKPVDEAAV